VFLYGAFMKKELLFSVTAKDCDWQYFRSGGPGGQNVNKVASGVRCIHRASGSVGQATDTRDQRQNRQLAFGRMCTTDQFKAWHRIETARRQGLLDSIEKEVEEDMNPHNIRVEHKVDGKWVEVNNLELPS
jgi:protein subunit release factor A